MFKIEETPTGYHMVEYFEDGGTFDYYLNGKLLLEAVIKNRMDCRQLGEEAALVKWNREECEDRFDQDVWPIKTDY